MVCTGVDPDEPDRLEDAAMAAAVGPCCRLVLATGARCGARAAIMIGTGEDAGGVTVAATAVVVSSSVSSHALGNNEATAERGLVASTLTTPPAELVAATGIAGSGRPEGDSAGVVLLRGENCSLSVRGDTCTAEVLL